MSQTIYQIDAFSGRVFAGNPAAVCPLDAWLPDATMQAIAAENNLSETAFFVPRGEGFDLRWFTPAAEVDLCGHATLATGALILRKLEPGRERVRFHTRSGVLEVGREGELLVMDFPAWPAGPTAADEHERVADALGAAPAELFASTRDILAVFDDEPAVRDLAPDFARLAALPRHGTIATAPGDGVDFVSRYFAPSVGIDEDPVTGSAHCTLTPYWSKRLGKTVLEARQVSRRGGELVCVDAGERVIIKGRAAFYLEGTLQI
jgi:PhzF family phenazine biosynthesis protein